LDTVGLYESRRTERGTGAPRGVLGERHRFVQSRAFRDHLEKRSLLRAMALQPETVQRQHVQDFADCGRREIDPVRARLDGLRLSTQHSKLGFRGANARGESVVVPSIAGVFAFYGFVAAMVQAEVEVKARPLEPVALSERAREPATDATCGVDPNEV